MKEYKNIKAMKVAAKTAVTKDYLLIWLMRHCKVSDIIHILSEHEDIVITITINGRG